jgi:hypothetical protein
MAYGHAERTLSAIRILEAQTTDLLVSLDHLDAEQAQWLQGVSLRGDFPSPDFFGPKPPSPCQTGKLLSTEENINDRRPVR